MAISYLLLGTNIEPRVDYLQETRALIEKNIGEITDASSIYETAAWGPVKQADYLNQVLKIKTDLTPYRLLDATSQIELSLGRERKVKWGPRTIDIDILFYDHFISEKKSLLVPHPFIPKRRFVLAPLEEIAPHLVHPVLKKTIRTLLQECNDPLSVKKTGFVSSSVK